MFKKRVKKKSKNFSIAIVMLLTFIMQVLGIGIPNEDNIIKAYNEVGDVTSITKGEYTPQIYMHFDLANGGWLEIETPTSKMSKQDGTIVFCVEPGINSSAGNHNASTAEGAILRGDVYYVDGGHLGSRTLSPSMVEELEKVIYYGWEESPKTIRN